MRKLLIFMLLLTFCVVSCCNTGVDTSSNEDMNQDRRVYRSYVDCRLKDGSSYRIAWSSKYGVSQEIAMDLDMTIIRVGASNYQIEPVMDSLAQRVIHHGVPYDRINWTRLRY